jgi:non-specific serine/threonine protein kinase
VRANALLGAAVLLWRAGHAPAALARCEASLGIRRAAGEPASIAWSLIFQAQIAGALDNRGLAMASLKEAVTLLRGADDPASLARALNNLGELSREAGDYRHAQSLYEEALTLDRMTGHRAGMALRLHNLAYVALHANDSARAARLFSESLALHRELEHRRGRIMCIEGFAAIAAASNQPERAARLFGAGEMLRDRLRTPPDSVERLEHDRFTRMARAALGASRFEAAWTAGRQLSEEMALAEAVLASRRKIPDETAKVGAHTANGDPLTGRELEIAARLAQGLTNRQIATEMAIATRTVDTHVSRILHKLGVASRMHVADGLARLEAVGPQTQVTHT